MQAIFGPKSDQIKHDMAKIMSGEITKPSETTVTEDVSDEPIHVEDVSETELFAPAMVTSSHFLKFLIRCSLKR